MICMGAGTNHWFNSDQTYRSFITMLLLCGCVGKNGGGWAHYVGQEKIRTFSGWAMTAFGLDWSRPPRQAQGTTAYYAASDQWRYDRVPPAEHASPLGKGLFEGKHTIDCYAKAARMGWMPSYPSFDRNPLDLADEARREGVDVKDYVVRELREDRLKFAIEDPDAPENFPRVFFVWRSNLMGSSAKGHEYFLRHFLGATGDSAMAAETPPELRPQDVAWRDDAPKGKLDLLVNLDFRMTSTGMHSDVVLAGRHLVREVRPLDDRHAPVRARLQPGGAAALGGPQRLGHLRRDRRPLRRARRRSISARAPTSSRRRSCTTRPARSRSRTAGCATGSWASASPFPGKTMPNIVAVERDYARGRREVARARPAGGEARLGQQGRELEAGRGGRVARPRRTASRAGEWPTAVRCWSDPSRSPRRSWRCRARPTAAWRWRASSRWRSVSASRSTGLAAANVDTRIRFHDTQVQPRTVITSPEWSGIDEHGRRYAPFTINTEHLKPWHTLSGRMHLYLDHEWMLEYGDGLPAFRPPLHYDRLLGDPSVNEDGRAELTLRYLTPHSKWSIHSEYQDNLHMLTLFRGGSGLWMSPLDAQALGVGDNDWIEVYNQNGIVSTRAVVTHRVPKGVCLLYHSKDRHLNTPRTELKGNRSGTENATTSITMKPTHMIGGYAQLSYGFNYYGPTGSNRDTLVIVRKRRSEVEF